MKYEEEYFTQTAYGPYGDFGQHEQRYQKIISKTEPKSLLDVGCAYGYIVKRCLRDGIKAVGVDISLWAGQQSREIIPGYFILATAWALPFIDKSFDCLYCEGVLEHIPEEQIEPTMSEFKRVARQRILAITFDAPNTLGHLCNHNPDWWFKRIPPNTFLYTGAHSSDYEDNWLYKDE